MFYKKIKIAEKIKLNERYFVLNFVDEEIAKAAQPGQFCQLQDVSQPHPILPRPFSIYHVNGNKFSFLIKIVGKSTSKLSQKENSEQVAVLGPLGNGFTIPHGKRLLLVSGGIGYAPLHFLRKKLMPKDNEIVFLHGGKDRYDIFEEDSHNFTEDGSVGKKGLVTAGVETVLSQNKINFVFACGPNPMLQKVSQICRNFNTELQVALETIMACGMGVCSGCVIKYKQNKQVVYKKACKDGPVFNGKKVVWDE